MADDLIQVRAYSDPVAIFGSDYAELQSFFQYSFPPKHLSAQSLGLQENLNDAQKDDLYNKMLTAIGMVNQDLCFTTLLVQDYRNDLPTIQQMGLTCLTRIVKEQ